MSKIANERIYPYQDKKIIIYGVLFLSAVTLFVLIALISALKDPKVWVPFVIFLVMYALILKVFGMTILNALRAYNKQKLFQESSLTTNATVLHKDFSIEGESDSDHYRLTISFNADSISKGAHEQRLVLEVPQTLYQSVGETIIVRYSTSNPRIAILKGEDGFSDGEPRMVESPGVTQSDIQEQIEIPTHKKIGHKKAGIKAVESFMLKEDQSYKIYAENRRLYGAHIGSQSGTSHDPAKDVSFYDAVDLNASRFLIEDKYNFKYSLEELKNIQLIAKKRRYNFSSYTGTLVIRFIDGKKRTFLVSSNIERAGAMLRAAGFSLE